MKIKMQDYERIYKTINAIILNENANPTVVCTFFSFYGSYILANHYKIQAQPVAGLCLYHLGGNNNILTFGELDGERLVSTTQGFHCWVLADGWLIDFMAPNFPKLLKNAGHKFTCNPKMMQKPISLMAHSVNDLKSEGDFFFEVNQELTKERAQYLSSSLAYADIADICIQWYRKPPRKMLQQIQITDEKGNQNSVSLSERPVIVGAW